MQVVVLGATGRLGARIVREALVRGHEVTAVSRNRETAADLGGARFGTADVTDLPALVAAVAGHDVVVAAVTDRSAADRSLIPTAARHLLQALPEARVGRLAFVGGGGSLESEPGLRGIDRADFPDAYRAEAEAQAEALEILRSSDGTVDWTYLSPPPHLLVPGPKTGTYRVQAGDRPVVDEHGESRISDGDFASALVDELEQRRLSRQRFTVGY